VSTVLGGSIDSYGREVSEGEREKSYPEPLNTQT
jgi:hypothetical protein